MMLISSRVKLKKTKWKLGLELVGAVESGLSTAMPMSWTARGPLGGARVTKPALRMAVLRAILSVTKIMCAFLDAKSPAWWLRLSR
jgi:hypothetical protein